MRASPGDPSAPDAAPRPPSLAGKFRAWTPMALLALAMAALFLFNSDRERYYAPLLHDTAKNLSIAANLSPQHNFRMFTRLSFGEDGEPAYEPYSRFPVGGFALIKLAILPFGGDLALKVFAARMLMLAFLAAAAFLAYHAIARVVSNGWIAAAAALTAFSTYYVLYYHNEVSNEFMMDLFGVMLTFHGMVVFVQEGRFRQLLIKTCVALLIGWHVYAFLLPFIALGFGRELVNAIAFRRREMTRAGTKALLLVPLRSRYLRLGATALLFGMAILAFNVISEYDALNGETPLTELPSVNSITGKLSFGSDGDGGFPWGDFLRAQFYRVAGSVSPALSGWPGIRLEEPPNSPPLPLVIVGVLAAGASLAGLLFIRRGRLLLGTLAASGFCWTLLVRNNTFFPGHQFEAIYYVGVPLTLVTLLLVGARRFGAERVLPGVAVAALVVFALSASQIIVRGSEAEREADRQQAVFADLAAIRKITGEQNVFVAQRMEARDLLYGDAQALDFHLAGSRLQYAEDSPDGYDFVLIPHRGETAPSLTPGNKIVFLYGDADPADLLRAQFDSIASSASDEPAARSVYDVSVSPSGSALVYLKRPCGAADVEREFFLHAFPESADDLPDWRKRHGYDNLDFEFPLWGVSIEGACAASVPLPDYAIRSVRTGQFGEDGELWNAAFPLDPDAYRAAFDSAASREPDARAAFDIYLDKDQRMLTYVKEPCAASDVERPFFLHVAPERVDDLPQDRREFGFDNLDFDFRLRGAVFDGKCAAQVPLPEYAVSSVRTGQWVRGGGELWGAVVRLGE